MADILKVALVYLPRLAFFQLAQLAQHKKLDTGQPLTAHIIVYLFLHRPVEYREPDSPRRRFFQRTAPPTKIISSVLPIISAAIFLSISNRNKTL